MNYVQKYRFQLLIVTFVLLCIEILYITQSDARKKLITYYALRGSSECGAGALPALPLFEISPTFFGYNYKLENNAHDMVKGSISITGNIHESSSEPIICPLQ